MSYSISFGKTIDFIVNLIIKSIKVSCEVGDRLGARFGGETIFFAVYLIIQRREVSSEVGDRLGARFGGETIFFTVNLIIQRVELICEAGDGCGASFSIKLTVHVAEGGKIREGSVVCLKTN
jgi:hypothetical protein